MTVSMLPGILVLLPLAVGPLPQPARTITADLCNGGSVEIPVERNPAREEPCAVKACHAGSCRKRFDLAQ